MRKRKKSNAKYFIGYKNDKHHYSQSFHKQRDISSKLKKTQYMSFLIKVETLI